MSSQQRYISNELTHFAGRGRDPDSQYQILLKILEEHELRFSPGEPYTQGEKNMRWEYYYNEKISDNKMIVSSMVCFCDIPFEDLSIHVQKYSSFGLSFTKIFVASKGGCPVLYIPKNAPVSYMDPTTKKDYFDKYSKEIYHYFDNLLCNLMDHPENNHSEIERIQKLFSFIFNHVLSFIKFFDHKLPEDHFENYYFEREWRILGNLCFQMEDVQRVILPRSFAKKFRKDCPEYYGQISFTDKPI